MPDGPSTCPDCATQIAPRLLTCPGCRRFVHADELKRLAGEAERAEAAAQWSAALSAWRGVQELLPPDSRQFDRVVAKLEELGPRAAAAPGPAAPGASGRKGFWAGIVGVVLFLVTKGKFLLGGLLNAGTFLTMFATFGTYWTLWGWRFALGLVLGVYVHEMGHVAMLRRYGIKAAAPMFIPGVGAFVRLKQYPSVAVEDARVGLAGPLWGLGASVVAWLIFVLAKAPLFGALANVNALINLFNLIPLWQLDGGRGFRSLTTLQRWGVVAAFAGAWTLTQNPLLFLPFLGGCLRAFAKDAPEKPDGPGFLLFLLLIGGLSAMLLVPATAAP